MKISRGRLNQYLLLNSEKSLSKHLVEKELFSEASFYDFIEKYKSIVIKPAFGPGEIYVTTDDHGFTIQSNSKLITYADKQEIYQHLVRNEIKQKYNIIQPVKFNSRIHFQKLITVHRRSPSDKWRLVSITKKCNTVFGSFFYMFTCRKIKEVSILAAKKLGDSYPRCNTIVIEVSYDLIRGVSIQDTVLHVPTSKWSQHQTLITKSSLKSFVPATDLLNKATFKRFLNKYNEIIIKPCLGQQGKGIVQISSTTHNSYEIHSGIKKVTKVGLEETYHFIEEHFLSDKYYLVQQKIPLATINSCPIDARVITQKTDATWIVTGKIVKVAAKEFIITNAAQKLLLLEDAIRDSTISHLKPEILEAKIDEICIHAANQLEANHTEITIIGFDIGVTHQGDIWIIEGNYVPSLSMFKMLEDKEMYTNMLKTRRK